MLPLSPSLHAALAGPKALTGAALCTSQLHSYIPIAKMDFAKVMRPWAIAALLALTIFGSAQGCGFTGSWTVSEPLAGFPLPGTLSPDAFQVRSADEPAQRCVDQLTALRFKEGLQ
jgi:hypothetical protein